MKVAITGIGTAVPEFKRSQQEAAELIASTLALTPAKKRLLKSIYKATGIEYRHTVLRDFFQNQPEENFPSTEERMKLYKQQSPALAFKAIKKCMSHTECDSRDITHVITVSCTGMYAPGLDIEIVQQLNLSSATHRTAINFMGCYGVFNALKAAHSICQANPDAKVLIVSVELCTLHFQKQLELDNIISNAIFSDGAAAAVVEANPSSKQYLLLSSFHCDLLPQASGQMAWKIGNQGFDIVLSSFLPETIRSGIHAFTHRLLKQSEFTLSDIDFYAIHPGGAKILEACENALNLKKEQNKFSYDVLKNYGNMSSATILFVLKKLWDTLTCSDHNKNIFSCAFGPGLTLESMLLRTHYV